MDEKVNKFHKFERIYFKIYLIIVGLSIVLIGMIYAMVDTISSIAEFALNIVMISLIYVVGVFFLSIVRTIKYFSSLKKKGGLGIWRSITIMLTSPIVTAILFIIIFALSLSLASCLIEVPIAAIPNLS